MRRARWVLFGLLFGCHPPATGAHAEEAACRRKCTADGLSMAGMVRMGENTASCVCEAPHATDLPASAMRTGSTGTVGGAISDSHYQTQPQASPSGTSPL